MRMCHSGEYKPLKPQTGIGFEREAEVMMAFGDEQYFNFF